jgi:CBS domain-containing membrane protein
MIKKEVKALDLPESIDLTEADVLEAMKEIPGYLDITPGDFKEVYRLAYRQAQSRLLQEVTAATIMTREVVTVSEESPLAEVAAAMGDHGISGVPVIDRDGRVTGIISEKDFLTGMGVTGPQNFMSLVANCLATKGCVALPIKKQTARDIMTAPPVTVTPHTRINEIALLFTTRQINRVPVVDADGKVLGIVTRGDLLYTTCHGERP